MVLQLKGKKPKWLSKNSDGTWKMHYDKFCCKEFLESVGPCSQYIKIMNKDFELVFNGPDLHLCPCGIPDLKENIGKPHSKIECEAYWGKGRGETSYQTDNPHRYICRHYPDILEKYFIIHSKENVTYLKKYCIIS